MASGPMKRTRQRYARSNAHSSLPSHAAAAPGSDYALHVLEAIRHLVPAQQRPELTARVETNIRARITPSTHAASGDGGAREIGPQIHKNARQHLTWIDHPRTLNEHIGNIQKPSLANAYASFSSHTKRDLSRFPGAALLGDHHHAMIAVVKFFDGAAA
jgi:hypothetical protein